MLLTPEQFYHHSKVLAQMPTGAAAIDWETSGLKVRDGAKAFILGFAYEDQTHCVRIPEQPDGNVYDSVKRLVSNPNLTYCAHSAVFEMSFLRHQFGAEIKGRIWDTMVFARHEYNNHKTYNLQACAERVGLSKHKPLMEWLKANKKLHHEAPDSLIESYVEQDAWLSLELYKHQRATLQFWNERSEVKIGRLVDIECRNTKAIFEMEDYGLRLDMDLVRAAIDHEGRRVREAESAFKRLTGVDFVDSRKVLGPIFRDNDLPIGITEKGQESFDAAALKGSRDHPIVRTVLEYRDAKKRLSTYWDPFEALHIQGKLYPSIRQSGTATGRYSMYEPNCQNWPDDSDDPTVKYPVRRALIAEPECFIVSMDYRQMEYRLIADESDDMATVERLAAGISPHVAMAERVGCPYIQAKIAVFARLYGCGIPKLALLLGISEQEADAIARAIDSEAPKIRGYCRWLIQQAQTWGFGTNFLGRRYFFDKGFEFKYPDYRTQGGCSDILRIAINTTVDFLADNRKDPRTRLLVPIHDELILSVHERDLGLISSVKNIMVASHIGKKHLDMGVAVHIGPNFHDLQEMTF